jgi:uncharacterized protein with PIN domain
MAHPTSRTSAGTTRSGAVLTLLPHRDLWPFLPPRRRRPQVEVPWDGTASLGHVVQAAGIPLTEVGELVYGGAAAQPTRQPRAGGDVKIGPVPRPQQVPGAAGFLLDVGLGTLARRLRILGLDAAYRNDADDDALLEAANDQHRVLLTQDRGLLMRRALWAGAHVRGNRPDDQLADVLARFAPRLAPWTRCTACNGELAWVPKGEIADQLQSGTRRRYRDFAQCRACRRVYWHGAHSRRLDRIVAEALSLTCSQQTLDRRLRY